MSVVYFFTDQNRTLVPNFTNCNKLGDPSYHGPSEKILLTTGSLRTQATVKRGAIGTVYEHYISAIEPGKISD